MKPEKILYALNDIDGQFLREAREETAAPKKLPRRFTVLIAAVVALMALTVTAFAAEEITGWFRQYFGQQTEESLTSGQVEFIEENEQIIAEAHEENGWTVELRSTISDGTKAYIIIGVIAPDGVNLEPRIVDDSMKDWYGPGNGMDTVTPSIPFLSADRNYYYQLSYRWREDGDGLANTMNMIYELNFGKCYSDRECLLDAPFGPDVDFAIHIEDIVREYDDEQYRRELLEGKYAGQTNIMFTHEEAQRLKQVEVLAEGTWDFTVNFGKSETGVELLSQPITVNALVWDGEDPDNMFDGKWVTQEVTIESFLLNPLSALIGCSEANVRFDNVYAVLKDGSQILLRDTGGMAEAESPIVLAEVDHILLADGTKLMVP